MSDVQGARQLEEKILRAFQETPYPENNILDTNAEYEECKIAFSFFSGKRWQDLLQNIKAFNSHYASVWFLSPEAFHYYLPALLIASLNWDKADMIGDDVAGGLAPPPYGYVENTDYFEGRINLFTSEQKQTIYDFFLFISENYADDFYSSYPAEQILNYWFKATHAKAKV